MALRRTKFEIIVAILQALLTKEMNTTQIMYRANISFIQARTYLRLLIASDLVRQITSGEIRGYYGITEKGKKLVEIHKQIRELIAPLEV